jgi:sulfatase modifying factor 1
MSDGGCVAPDLRVALAGGTIQIGAGDWEAEGRVRAGTRLVAGVVLDAFEITEAAYGACVEGGRCVALPMSGEPGRALGGITRAEAEAYCRFRGGRLPSSDEWTLAAAGTRSRRYPWGDTGAVCRRGAWGLLRGPCGFEFDAPGLAGAHPDGATPEGVHDLAGNVSEWVTDGVGDRGEVAGRDQGTGEVRGGSYAVELATDLRTWMTRRVPVQERSAEIGARCAYSAQVTEPIEAPPVVALPVP